MRWTSDQTCQNEVEPVFETILVMSESEFAKKIEIINPHGPEVDCRKTLGDESGKNTEVVHIENCEVLNLGDETFSRPKSQRVMMTAARQMAINDSPDKLELNGPCDEVKQPLTNKFKTFQSDVNVEAIEIFDDNLQWRKSPHENKVPKTPTRERNVIVHSSSEDNKEEGLTLQSFLDNISFGHLITVFTEQEVDLSMIPKLDHNDLKELGVKTFGQRFKIINAGKLLGDVINNEKGSAVVSYDNNTDEDIMNVHKNSIESAENSEELSLTKILNVKLPYERTYSSTKVKNAPRKSEELVISNIEDYCSGDRSEMLTVVELMNFTELILSTSFFHMEASGIENNNTAFDSFLDCPNLESTSIEEVNSEYDLGIDLLKEAEEEFDSEMSLIVDEIVGKNVIGDKVNVGVISKCFKQNVLKVSTGSVEDAEEIVDKITNKRKPEYIVSRTRKRRKMGW